MFDNPIKTHTAPGMRVDTFGGLPQMRYNPEVLDAAIAYAVAQGADPELVCVMVPASGPGAKHFKTVAELTRTTCIQDRVWADAIHVPKVGSVVIVPTADCQTGVIKNTTTNDMFVFHGGKPAMRTWDHLKAMEAGALPELDDEPNINIVEACLKQLQPEAFAPNIHVYTTGAIGARHYRHDNDELRTQLDRAGFWRRYGQDAFAGKQADGELDLYGMTRSTCRRYKVPDSNIKTDGLCTICTDGLVSYWQESDMRNITIAFNLPLTEY